MCECCICGSEEIEYFDQMENDYCEECMYTVVQEEEGIQLSDFTSMN